MKKNGKVIGIIILMVNLLLIFVFGIFYFKTDRTAPKISFQAGDLTYFENMNRTELLQNITAYDNEEGDVTDRIVIEKVVENREEGKAVIFYAVSDTAGNVVKDSREFTAVFEKGNKEDHQDIGQEANPQEAVTQIQETAIPSSEQTPEPTATPTPTPIQTPEPMPTPTPEPTPEPIPAEPVVTVNPAAPILILKSSEVKTTAGSGPAWVNVIQTLKDDKDSYETLFNNLKVSKYDMNKAGTYQVTITTEDSDGNKSAAVPVTIYVK